MAFATTSSAIQASWSNAVALQEGFGASATNKPTRTNNPDDIGNTDSGATNAFATPAQGWAAADHQTALIFSGGPGTQYSPNMTIAEIGSHFASSPGWAAGVAGRLGVPVTATPAQMLAGQVKVNAIPRPDGGGQSSVGNQNPDTEGVDDSNAPFAQSVEGSTQAITQSDLTPSLITTEGTDATPWFSDPAILQVNGATKAIAAPVTFAIYYDLNNSPLPVSIKLNASLQTVERSLHHVINRQATRTGFLLTLWGMQPDQITGSGNTGVFMNQLGLTDLFSLSGTPSAIEQSVLAAFSSKSMETSDALEAALASDGMFRVAAKDAFVEFLFAFKNNGIVWFQNPNYTGYTSEQMQLGPNAWSPQTGTSSFQNQGRRNDVMTRGGVAMYYRNSVYYGYFKSFNWTEDAEKPFSWNFTFVFCVECTVTCVNRPDLSQWDALT